VGGRRGRVARLTRWVAGATLVALLSTCATMPPAPNPTAGTSVAVDTAEPAVEIAVGPGGPSPEDNPVRYAEADTSGEDPAAPPDDRDEDQPPPPDDRDEDQPPPPDDRDEDQPPPPVQASETGRGEPTHVVVTRIGVRNPLVPVGLHPDRTLVVPEAAQVAGLYTGAPRPGETGPAVVVGHNAWQGARGVFARLHELRPGDVIEIHHDGGPVVRFAVERLEQHPKAAFPTEHVYGNTARSEIRVITCGGVFDRSQGRHLDNIVAFGVRID
jgi:hypothetical protein